MPEDTRDNVRPMWSEDELDRALAALRPATDASPASRTSRIFRASQASRVDEQALGRVRSEVLAAAGRPGQDAPVRRRRRWAGWVAAAATVATVTAGTLVVQTVQFGGRAPSAAAVSQLNSAADRVAPADQPLGPGQYRYVATHAWWMSTSVLRDGSYSYLAENLLETWVPADQKQEWLWRRDVTGARKWIGGTEEEARAAGVPVDAAGWPEGEWRAPCGDWFAAEKGRLPCAGDGSWQIPTPEFLSALPRDADELFDRLRADTGSRGADADLEMLVYVADVLRTGLVPADLRAALYRVLARVPGIDVTEQVANLDGQKGAAYGISAKGIRRDVIVDPVTGQFIGEREVTEAGFNNVPPGSVISYTSMTTAVVDGMGVRPTG